jgi:hypothetical protein
MIQNSSHSVFEGNSSVVEITYGNGTSTNFLQAQHLFHARLQLPLKLPDGMVYVGHGLNGFVQFCALWQLPKTLFVPIQFNLVGTLGSSMFDSGNAQSVNQFKNG